MREMIQKIMWIALILLSACTHPEKHIIDVMYQFAMTHSETLRTAAQLIHIIRTL